MNQLKVYFSYHEMIDKKTKMLEDLQVLEKQGYHVFDGDLYDIDYIIRKNPEIVLKQNLLECDIYKLIEQGICVYTTMKMNDLQKVGRGNFTLLYGLKSEIEYIDCSVETLLRKLNSNEYSYPELENLREKAFRLMLEKNYDEQHILVCLSPSPSNKHTIYSAWKMSHAFQGKFSALYVQGNENLSEKEKNLLNEHVNLARKLGAKIETVYGDDVAFQIAEYARLFKVTKVVLGRGAIKHRFILSQPSLTDRLIHYAPQLDIHIIPAQGVVLPHKKKKPVKLIDLFKCIGFLLVASVIGLLFEQLGFDTTNIVTVYILAVMLASIVTENMMYSFLLSLASVLTFNFLFTEPRFTLQAYEQGYPVTFIIMFISAILTGGLAGRLKNAAKYSATAAARSKILFDTNQLLGKAHQKEEIIDTMASQLNKLFHRQIVVSMEGSDLYQFNEQSQSLELVNLDIIEKSCVAWVKVNNKHAGATTKILPDANYLYLAIRVNEKVYGVVGVEIKNQPLESFEYSIFVSILNETALALENEKNLREKEEAAILAKNEQLRANLLRAISHDLRTPLTSISGNASNLLYHEEQFEKDTRKQIYLDIYDDAMWLVNLVENLLSVTRIEEGRLNLNLSEYLVDEVIEESLNHVNRNKVDHLISVIHEDEFLLAKMDARLIVQVIINIVDNAIKYTPKGSHIEIHTKQVGKNAQITISDNGPGINDEMKKHIFEMFYSGANEVADSRRSLGLGLSLCRSIILSHQGTIKVEDHQPSGASFVITLPIGEVQIHE